MFEKERASPHVILSEKGAPTKGEKRVEG